MSNTQDHVKLALDALVRVESAIDWHLGRSSFTQTRQLKGMGHSDSVRKELFAAHDNVREVIAALKQSPAPQPPGFDAHDMATAAADGFRDGVASVQPPGDAQQGVVCEPQRAVTSDGWTDWICPKPVGYLMQCCDCGLVHEVDSRVAHYKPRPSEEYSVVDDPDMQAQWRMRRRDDLAATAQASEPSAEVECVWNDPSKATVLVMHGHQLRNGQKLYAAPPRAVEPTTEMLEAMSEVDATPDKILRLIYKSGIAAAPQPGGKA